MQRDMTMPPSGSGAPGNWFAGRRAIAVGSLCLCLFLGVPVPDVAALPSADEVLKELRISDSDKQSILNGKIVKWTATEGSDRELAIGMAFLIKAKPPKLVELFRGLRKCRLSRLMAGSRGKAPWRTWPG